MSSVALDASAVLALLLDEDGAALVAGQRRGARLVSVNACEVIERLLALGHSLDRAVDMIAALDLALMDFDFELAAMAASLKSRTRGGGLSLGDRACLALAHREGLPALTADRAWSKIDVGVEVRLIR